MPIINLVYEAPREWKPGANTIAYYPLNSTDTINDTSGNNRNLTNSGVSFGTYGGVDCAYFNGSSYMYRSASLFSGSTEFTINLWYQRTSTTSTAQNILAIGSANGTNSFILWLMDNTNVMYLGGWTNDRNTGYTPPLNTWINICITHKSGTVKVYINGNTTPTYTGTVSYGITSTATNIGSGVQGASGVKMYGYQSKLIFENKEWTADENSKYVNSTKSLYGIS